jgi:hypothetical protein
MNKKDIARDIYDMVEGDKDLFFEIASSEMTDEEANQYWNEILDDEEAFFTSREPIEESVMDVADIEKIKIAFHYDFEDLIFEYAEKLGADLSKDTLSDGDTANEIEDKVFKFIEQSVRDRVIG